MSKSIQARFKASGLHFLFSLVLFSLLVFIVIQLWYPQPYFSASGGWQGLQIIALVDIVLGPCLTFIIYQITKPRKELMMDIGLIVLIQLAALAYGIYTIHTQRPVALAFWEDKFYTIPAQALNDQAIDPDSLHTFSSQTPARIYVQKPLLTAEKKTMLKRIQDDKLSPLHQLDLYRPFNTHRHDIMRHSIDINKVIQANSDMATQLQILLEKTSTLQSSNFYLILESKYQNIILVFNAQAEQIGFLKAPYKDSP